MISGKEASDPAENPGPGSKPRRISVTCDLGQVESPAGLCCCFSTVFYKVMCVPMSRGLGDKK